MATLTVQSPATVPANHAGWFSVALVGEGTDWTASTPFAVSGVSGVVLIKTIVNGPTSAIVVITTGATTALRNVGIQE